MPFDVDRSLQGLSLPVAADLPWPEGAPERDYLRSHAAARVGQLAARSGLFLFHFEHRAHRPLPLEFLPDGADPDLAEPPAWADGRLPEAKYQSFRHDLLIGSFHPGHRGKWTTHELCHALVGFGWKPGASPLWHATAARLAELLPVVLYYFLDEVGLRRCPDHQGGGPLFRAYCAACEDAVEQGPIAELDRGALVDARRYLDRELAAVARTRRTGRPIGHRWGSLDLCTDGIAYAASHGARLTGPAFERFAAGFLEDGVGCWSDLDDLAERVVAVARAMTEGSELAPMADSPESGRETWARQDLGWRLIEASLELDGERRAQADAAIDALAGGASADAVRAQWPGAEDVFQVGYGEGLALGWIGEGLSTVCPLTLELFDDAGIDAVGTFARADDPARRPIGDRFADWVARVHGDVPGALARFEAALRHAGSDGLTVLGPGEGEGISPHVRVVDEPVDPIDLSEDVEAGELVGRSEGGRLVVRTVDGHPIEPEPTRLYIVRNPDGEIGVVEADSDVAPEVLHRLGITTFDRWPL